MIEAIRDCDFCPAVCGSLLDANSRITDATIAVIRRTLTRKFKNIKSIYCIRKMCIVALGALNSHGRMPKKLNIISNKTQTQYIQTKTTRIFFFVWYTCAFRGNDVIKIR